MASVVYLKPRSSHAGVKRLLAEIQAALTAGVYLGDRRAIIGELTHDLHRNFERLQIAMTALQACGAHCDPARADLIRSSEEACCEILDQLGPLLTMADDLIALLDDRTERAPSTP